MDPKRLLERPNLPKLVQWILLFILTFLTRYGGKGGIIFVGGEASDAILGLTAVYGCFVFVSVQIVGVIFEEEAHLTNLIFAIVGLILTTVSVLIEVFSGLHYFWRGVHAFLTAATAVAFGFDVAHALFLKK